MANFVKIEFPKCSICLDPFGPQDEAIGHAGVGEKHPFHKNCLQNWIDQTQVRDPIYGVRPIKCPVCKIELPSSLPSDPIQNPAPSLRAATAQLSVSPSVSPVIDEMVEEAADHWFDRLDTAQQYRLLTEHLQQGVIDQTAYREYVDTLFRSR